MNLLRFLNQQKNSATDVHVISTQPHDKPLFSLPGILIHRFGKWTKPMPALSRLKLYGEFNFRAIRMLKRHHPGTVMYFETLSAGPALYYKTRLNTASRLFIHYHEYASPDEVSKGMVVFRQLHKRELPVYKRASWISHTNPERATLFMKDSGEYAPSRVEVLPNYPSRSWIRETNAMKKSDKQLRFVYVGALSLETTYIREWLHFVCRFPEKYSCTIYSDNYSDDVLPFIEALHASNITFGGSLPYETMPRALTSFDVGLILYKGHIPNYVYNAPNKLFEYHACGLDVLFPPVMKGCLTYATTNTFPVITAFDFENPDEVTLERILSREGRLFRPSPYYYEESLVPLAQQLLNIDPSGIDTLSRAEVL